MSSAEYSQCLTIPSERENICCKEINKKNIAWHIGILTVKYLHMGPGADSGIKKGGGGTTHFFLDRRQPRKSRKS